MTLYCANWKRDEKSNYVPNYVLNYVIYGCGLTFASTYAQSAIIIMNDIFIALVEIFLTFMAL